MTLLLSNRDGGKTDENGHYRFHVKSWTGNILSGFAVTQNSPLGMSVLVGTGDARVDYSDYGYTLWNNASATATITTADPSNPRIDRVVVYIDRGATPQTVTPNNPGIPKIAVVAGTAAGSPVKANDAAVQSAVGSGNPWFEIATVVVGAGVTQITNANITDTRSYVKAPSNSVGSSQLETGMPVQIVGTTYSAVATGTTTIPQDDTIPQITEGTEFMTQTITPKATTNKLLIEVSAFLTDSSTNCAITGALFQDSTANALAASQQFMVTATGRVCIIIRYIMTAGTTSPTTFRFRAGPDPGSGGTMTFNGFSGSRFYGGAALSSITITEYKA